MATKSSERTKHYLESNGYLWGKTEQFNMFTKQRKDLFNICDGIAIKSGKAYCIQATGGDVNSHIKKIQENPLFPEVSKALPVYILAWRKLKKVRGGKATYWDCKILNLFQDSVVNSSL